MAMNKMKVRFCFALLAAGGLAACGQRGALYLPEQSRNVVVTPAAAPDATVPAATPADVAATPDPTEEQRRNSTAPAK
jgi:predicted small lipoprotein YifL